MSFDRRVNFLGFVVNNQVDQPQAFLSSFPLLPRRLLHCRRALICLEVLSSFRCRVVYLRVGEGGVRLMRVLPCDLRPGLSYPPQRVQETLHAVGRLLFQHLDAPLHLQTGEGPINMGTHPAP